MAVILGHELGARGGVWSHSTPRWADRPEGDMVQSRQALLTPRGWRGHDLGLPSLTVSRGRLVAPSMGSECRPGKESKEFSDSCWGFRPALRLFKSTSSYVRMFCLWSFLWWLSQ